MSIFSTVGSWFLGGSPLAGLAIKAVIALVIVGGIGGAFWHWRNEIRDSTFKEIFEKQTEELAKQNQEQFDKFKSLIDEQNKLIADLAAKKTEVIIQHDHTNTVIEKFPDKTDSADDDMKAVIRDFQANQNKASPVQQGKK